MNDAVSSWLRGIARDGAKQLGGHVEEIQIMTDEQIDAHLRDALFVFLECRHETYEYDKLFKQLLLNRGLVVVEAKLLD